MKNEKTENELPGSTVSNAPDRIVVPADEESGQSRESTFAPRTEEWSIGDSIDLNTRVSDLTHHLDRVNAVVAVRYEMRVLSDP